MLTGNTKGLGAGVLAILYLSATVATAQQRSQYLSGFNAVNNRMQD
jgi:hypothetical protein